MAKIKKSTGKKPAAPPASTRGLMPCAVILLIGMAIVMRHAALPPDASGTMLAVFEPATPEDEVFASLTRAEARDLVAGNIEGAFAPPPSAIAHHLIKTWSEG